VELSFMCTDLSDLEMGGAYGGLPQFGLGVSFDMGERTRFFVSGHFGSKSGDPYHNLEGLSDEDGIQIDVLPLMMGLKVNASTRPGFRLYMGGALQYVFFWESVSNGDLYSNPQDIEASGAAPGYYFFMGPEIPLGRGGNALGAEFGFGGSEGTAVSSSHSHGVDLRGIHARVYFTIGL